VLVYLLVISSWANEVTADERVAHRAKQYQRLLTATAYERWGATAPISLLAAQVHQESRWNPAARSKYACGLTQFTPDTAKWISDTYRVAVGAGDCINPIWALRAQSQYMYILEKNRQQQAATSCDSWRFALWDYNGGAGWTNRDKKKTALAGMNPALASHVALFNAGRREDFFLENRGYDKVILDKWKPFYATWGGPLVCGK
jgi:membrane-bound lytic murein transglycosylase MltF